MHPEASLLGKDQFDEIAFPFPEDAFIEIKFNHDEADLIFNRDIVHTSSSQIWKVELSYPESSDDIVLNWDNSYFGNGDSQLYLVDEINSREQNMRLTNSFRVSKGSKRLKIAYGNKDFIKQMLEDNKNIIIGEPFPNPAKGMVHIPLKIDGKSSDLSASITVYNSLGIQVYNNKIEVNNELTELTWQNDHEGLYHIILAINDDVFTKRVLIKK